ncbi:MAG: hypothetical protein ABSG43_02580 [Solirubrobacteraceae bacterium]|jgi:hypothetical protein
MMITLNPNMTLAAETINASRVACWYGFGYMRQLDTVSAHAAVRAP